MIVETIFSTLGREGNPNFAPMGLVWGDEIVTVHPYLGTQTYSNLHSAGYGVANITDDVLAYVSCALYDATLNHFQAKVVPGIVFSKTCSWRELEVISEAETGERREFECRVVHEGRQKDFLGFRRASNAVIEATILATRKMLIDPIKLNEGLAHFREIVERTGDAADRQAFQMVHDFIRRGA